VDDLVEESQHIESYYTDARTKAEEEEQLRTQQAEHHSRGRATPVTSEEQE